MNEQSTVAKSEKVVCPATRDLAVRLFIVAAMLIGYGFWCFYEAHIKGQYPYKSFAEDMNTWFSWVLNYWGAYVFTALGFIPLFWGMKILRRKLVADENGVGYEGKEQISWSSITSLDASELKDKQILYLNHGDGKKLKLDGYNLKNFKELISFVEEHAKTGDS